MASNAVLKVLENAKPAIANHWATFSEFTRESPALTERVDEALEKYCAAISDLNKGPALKGAILAAIKTLFEELDEIDEQADEELLSTDERDLLVPVVIDAASAAGLDVSEFEGRDPTQRAVPAGQVGRSNSPLPPF
jgi:hypothetical protein